MKSFFSRSKSYDSSESSDPSPPRGIDRKTILLVAAALGTIVTVLFLATQRSSDGSDRIGQTTLNTDVEYGGFIELPVTAPLAEPPQGTDVPAWDPGRVQAARGDETDPRTLSFYQALGSGGLLLNRPPESTLDSEGGTDPHQRTPPRDRVLLEGSMIPAVLEAPINSDRPGPVKARVTQDVTDTRSMTETLIPVGTRVLGALGPFESGAVSVSWHRLIFPDGSTMNIGEMPSMDDGGGGLVGNVDRHRFSSFGRGTLMAVLGTASAVGTAQLGNYSVFGPALAQQLSTGGTRTMQQLRRPPTITVPQGHPFQIWVTQDIQF